MKKKYVLLVVINVVVLSGVSVALYLYNKPHADVSGMTPELRVSAMDLYKAFQKDETAANRQFGDKVIAVTGAIAAEDVTDSTASLQLTTNDPAGSVNCAFVGGKKEKGSLPARGSVVTVKGRCTGFLQDVNLVDCVVETN